MFPGSGDQKNLARYLAIGQIGLEMAAPAVIGVLADSYFNCSPWGVAIGAAAGLAGGLIHLVQLTKPDRQPGRRPESGPPGPSEGGQP